MCARTALGHPLLDQLQRLGDLSLGGAGETQPLQSTRDHRLDPDAIAGRDVKNGRESGIVIAPVHVLGREPQILGRRLRAGQGEL